MSLRAGVRSGVMFPVGLALLVVLSTYPCAAQDPPEIIERPRDQTISSIGSAVFSCRASGNPEPTIEWLRNGRKLPSQARFMVLDIPGGGSVLRIDNVRGKKDEGRYECVAENRVGDTVTEFATLTIIDEDDLPSGFPRIVQEPQVKAVEIGRSAALVCEAVGNPQPVVKWFREDLPLDMSNQRYSILPSGALQITEAQKEDDGQYQCMAENSLGSVFSYRAKLYARIRRVPPHFSIPPDPVYEVMPGNDLNITCVAYGSPMPYVRWKKGAAIDLTPENQIPQGRNILQLKDIREPANYTCVAQSNLGTVDAVTTVLVQALPRPPTNVRVSEVTSTSVRVTWNYDIGGEDIQYYVIQYKPRMANQEYSEISGVVTLFYHIRNLSPYTEYEFYIRAVNSIGRGAPSEPAIATTGETEPGSSPRNVQVRPLSSSTMVIQWDPPVLPNGQVTGYKVYYTTNPSRPLNGWESQMVDSNQLTTISDLTPHTIYTIRVQAFTSGGPGPMSAPVQVKTQQGVPSQPSDLRSKEATSDSVTLEWTRPAHSGESIVNYELYWNDTFTKEKFHRRIPAVTTEYTLTDLYPNTLYYVWVAARSRRGEGAATPPLPVRTEEYIPRAPPQNVSATAEDPHSLRVTWAPPPPDKQNGDITYYKLFYVDTELGDSEATEVMLPNPAARSFIIDELHKWTEYRIWMRAGTAVGDGPSSYPVLARTDEDVPGEPRNVNASAVNSTSITVRWQPPAAKEQHGVIRGYQIYVQELNQQGNLLNKPLRFDVAGGGSHVYNVTSLQPDTPYKVQVSALTRKGDGTRSEPVRVTTPGGVPSRPTLVIKVVKQSEKVTLDVEWSRPIQAFGELMGYRLRYGPRDGALQDFRIDGTLNQHKTIHDLERGIEYEFRVAARNNVGFGQEAVTYYMTPEGAPSGPPTNITIRFQTTDVVAVTWDLPLPIDRNGQILGYDIQFYKHRKTDPSIILEKNTSDTKMVFTQLEENTDYLFRVRAYTSKGLGPYSDKRSIRTEPDLVRPPINLQGMATSDHTIEVWWENVHSRGQVIGYQVFYTMMVVDDLDHWRHKALPITHSAELRNLERHATYAISVVARTKSGLGRLSGRIHVKVKPEDVPVNLRTRGVTTHSMTLTWGPPIQLNPKSYQITYDAVKEFVDSEGMTQVQHVPKKTKIFDPSRCTIALDPNACSFPLKELSPFTTYTINVTAVPLDNSYRPPAKITVTTKMAAPQPMVKPDFFGVVGGSTITMILPHASEEYGPISHYYLVVIPNGKVEKYTDSYVIDDLIPKKKDAPAKMSKEEEPYIAAMFLQRNIPYSFSLGDSKSYEGFINRPLDPDTKYRIFVRAFVDTPMKHLYTSSPYSEPVSLSMRKAPSVELPQRPNPSSPIDASGVAVDKMKKPGDTVWIIGLVIGIVAFAIAMILACIVMSRRRRQQQKSPDQSAVTKPLMSDTPAPTHAISDPVEMRRLNFQTPAMMSHPPIPVHELPDHVDMLKANDNLKFSQEYESIEPGQQFTWDNSNLDVNKPKNRYANVIAYDHSRVALPPLDAQQGSDYINANYCDGYRKNEAYIATQGPLPDTYADFWRMVWEQHSATVVMMTRLEERARIKCDMYWPSRGTEVYGPMHITLTDVQELATYCIRTFQMQRNGSSERREVRQFQFTAWPDHGVPDHPTPFLMFLRRVKTMNPPDAGPIIVHCSAGVGRTGCFIVIDSMLERMRQENTVDVYGHVTCLRAQRNYMVQTEDQYIFIHDALLEAVLAGNTEVAARNLQNYLTNLLQPIHPGDSVSGMEFEFKKLANIKAQPSRFVSANLPVNKFKNRLVNILPFESTRVCLQPMRAVEGSDYINANFVDGYRGRNAYVATQGPLAETTDDFWRMLWEHNSTIVVMLTKLKEMGREKCHQYWPSDRSARYQYYVVDPIAEYNLPQYILREFKVTDARDGSTRTIRQFQFTDWPEQGVPKSGEGFIDFIGQVHKTKAQFGQEGPITVHCSAGVGRTGVFITLSIVLERMQQEGVVDMFQTVRTLRTQRPAMVQTESEYHFCYEAALTYLNSFDLYAGD